MWRRGKSTGAMWLASMQGPERTAAPGAHAPSVKENIGLERKNLQNKLEIKLSRRDIYPFKIGLGNLSRFR